MIKKNIRVYFKDKISIIILAVIVILYLWSYLIIKDQFFNGIISYQNTFFNNYIQSYYEGDISLFLEGYNDSLYLPNELKYLASYHFIYKQMHFTMPFYILLMISPLIIFYIISRVFGDELNFGTKYMYFSRISRFKYFISKSTIAFIIVLINIVLPRILILICLKFFFVNGYSDVYNLDNTFYSLSNIPFSRLDNLSSISTIILDIFTLVLYSLFYSILSLFFISKIKSKKLASTVFYISILFCYFLYEFFAFGLKQRVLFFPDIISQFSFYHYFKSFPTKLSYLPLLYQGFTIILISYLSYKTIRIKIK